MYSSCSNVPVKYVASKVRFYVRKLVYFGWSMNYVKKGESFRHVLSTVVIQSNARRGKRITYAITFNGFTYVTSPVR